jgi:hypothetical protein
MWDYAKEFLTKKDDADRYYLEVHAEEEQVLKTKIIFLLFYQSYYCIVIKCSR